MTTVGKIKIMLAKLPDDAIIEAFHMEIKNVSEKQIDCAARAHNEIK